jgi:hypothetical protein
MKVKRKGPDYGRRATTIDFPNIGHKIALRLTRAELERLTDYIQSVYNTGESFGRLSMRNEAERRHDVCEHQAYEAGRKAALEERERVDIVTSEGNSTNERHVITVDKTEAGFLRANLASLRNELADAKRLSAERAEAIRDGVTRQSRLRERLDEAKHAFAYLARAFDYNTKRAEHRN